MKAIWPKAYLFGLFNEAIRRILVLQDGGYGLYTILYCICTVHYASSLQALCNSLDFILLTFAVKEMATLTALT